MKAARKQSKSRASGSRDARVTRSQVPALASYERKTPRSLKRTLVMLRESGAKRTVQEMADWLRVGKTKMNNLEGTRKAEEMSYEMTILDLQRYQDVYGIPTGITMLISQILAAARDNRPKHLEVIAGMARALVERIDSSDKRKAAIAELRGDPEFDPAESYAPWDNYIFVLVGAVWGAVPRKVRTSMLNPERMDKHDERQKELKSKNAAIRAANAKKKERAAKVKEKTDQQSSPSQS